MTFSIGLTVNGVRRDVELDDPRVTLLDLLRERLHLTGTKKGMTAALALAVKPSSELTAFSFERLTRAVGALLDRAVAAGDIRADVSPEDLLRALIGMCYMHDQPGWQTSVMRLLDVFVDGLRRPTKEIGTSVSKADDTKPDAPGIKRTRSAPTPPRKPEATAPRR
jgi:hypothetical protein